LIQAQPRWCGHGHRLGSVQIGPDSDLDVAIGDMLQAL
jgi:hypothetical protein